MIDNDNDDKMLEDWADFDCDTELRPMKKIVLAIIVGIATIILSPFILVFEAINLIRK